MLEAGLTRQKNTANIIGKNLMTIALGITVYYAVGYAVMYGDLVGGFLGTSGFFLSGATGGAGELITTEIDFAFQAMFAATAATIVSGAVAERIKFGAYIVIAVVLTGLIYPVVGAWQWGGGWLSALGFHDFAGSTIVHLTGGVAALVGAAILGPRIGRFAADGEPHAIPGHNIAFVALGTLLLFFGWFGFNGGSVLALDGPALSHVIVATSLAGAAGGLAAAFYTRWQNGSFDVAMTANGILAGLVAITAGADVVSHLLALVVGVIAGVVVVVAVSAIDRMGIDDVVGAGAVHGVCGALGTLWVGIAHTEAGLLYGGGLGLLGSQVAGVVATVAWVALTTAVLFTVLKAAGFLRVPEREEIEGLDLHEHGVPGYPELIDGSGATSYGLVQDADRVAASVVEGQPVAAAD
jgi:Amt family ammonium transporter